MKPPCHSRPPRPRAMEVNAGLSPDGRQTTMFVPVPFEDRCAVHDGRGIGPNGESYPFAHGWDCAGCPWLPEHARAEMEARHEANAYRERLSLLLGPEPPPPPSAVGLRLEPMTL